MSKSKYTRPKAKKDKESAQRCWEQEFERCSQENIDLIKLAYAIDRLNSIDKMIIEYNFMDLL